MKHSHRHEPERRLTLFDAMVLVAAVGIGLVLVRASEGRAIRMEHYVSHGVTPPPSPLGQIAREVVRYWPVVTAATPTLLILRLRRPRPSRWRLFSPPGLVACAAATIATILSALWITLGRFCVYRDFWGRTGSNRHEFKAWNVALDACSSPAVAFAVAAAWGSMALAGRWRPEPSWIDRAGRLVGLFWLALIAVRFRVDFFY
jgi:hypothetical protein